MKAIEYQKRIAELEAALEQFAKVAETLLSDPTEVNWSALQHNAIEARLLLMREQMTQ